MRHILSSRLTRPLAALLSLCIALSSLPLALPPAAAAVVVEEDPVFSVEHDSSGACGKTVIP